jgi:hypothetical protein
VQARLAAAKIANKWIPRGTAGQASASGPEIPGNAFLSLTSAVGRLHAILDAVHSPAVSTATVTGLIYIQATRVGAKAIVCQKIRVATSVARDLFIPAARCANSFAHFEWTSTATNATGRCVEIPAHFAYTPHHLEGQQAFTAIACWLVFVAAERRAQPRSSENTLRGSHCHTRVSPQTHIPRNGRGAHPNLACSGTRIYC